MSDRSPDTARHPLVDLKVPPGLDDATLLAHAVIAWLRVRGPIQGEDPPVLPPPKTRESSATADLPVPPGEDLS